MEFSDIILLKILYALRPRFDSIYHDSFLDEHLFYNILGRQVQVSVSDDCIKFHIIGKCTVPMRITGFNSNCSTSLSEVSDYYGTCLRNALIELQHKCIQSMYNFNQLL